MGLSYLYPSCIEYVIHAIRVLAKKEKTFRVRYLLQSAQSRLDCKQFQMKVFTFNTILHGRAQKYSLLGFFETNHS